MIGWQVLLAILRLLEVLILARHESGLTQEALAARLGRPQSFVAKIERGERRLDVIEFCAVVRAMGLEPTATFNKVVGRLPLDIEV